MVGTAIFNSKKTTHVLLLWDKDSCGCAMKAAVSKDAGAYKLTYNPKSNGAGFSAVTFLNYIHYDWTETRAFNAEWDDAEQMLVFQIPKEYIGKGVPKGYLGSLKRGDRVKAEIGQEGTTDVDQEVTEATS
jgi:hypothetical protein